MITREVRTWTCPQCAAFTPVLREGVCVACCEENQARLDAHNAAFDAWEKLTARERERRIREAGRT